RLNLISIRKLDAEGYSSYFGEGKWKLTNGSLIVAKGEKRSTLYLMSAKLSKGDVNVLDDNSIKFWYKRLGHMSEKRLQMLIKKILLSDVKGTPLKTCTDYLAGKQHRVAFHRDTLGRKSHVLDLVHINVCYMKDMTVGGAFYFVIF